MIIRDKKDSRHNVRFITLTVLVSLLLSAKATYSLISDSVNNRFTTKVESKAHSDYAPSTLLGSKLGLKSNYNISCPGPKDYEPKPLDEK